MLRTPLISRIPLTNQRSQISTTSSNAYQSFSCSILLCCFSCGKLLISLGVLLADTNDYPALKIWLILETISDFITSALLILDTRTYSPSLFSRSVGRDQADSPHSPQAIDEERQEEVFREQRESFSSTKAFKTAWTLNNLYYFALWVWGHFLYYQACDDCLKSVQAIANLVFLYIYCGYFYVACSLLMAIFNRNLLSFFSFSPASMGTKAKSFWPDFSSLSLKSYTTDIGGSSECYICLMSYHEGDGLAQLPCNSKHHFHEACIKKWLKVNNACPLCRKAVTGSNETPHVNEVELPTISVH